MDHQIHVIWTVAVCALAGIFALLHLIAAGSQLKRHFHPAHLLMLAGALGTAAAAADCLYGGTLDWLIMLQGGWMVCAAALWNGMRAQGETARLHLSHHIIRAGIAAVLVCAMIWV